MTLVAMYHQFGRTVAVADILLSSSNQYKAIELPTREKPYEYNEQPEAMPTGFVQKLTLINDKVILCWSGNRHQAFLLAKYIQSKFTEINLLPNLLDSYTQQDKLGVRGGVIGVLLAHLGDRVVSIDIGVSRLKVGRFDEVWLFGSGCWDAHSFFSAGVAFGQSENIDPTYDALIMMGHSMAAQHSEGYGLENYWGGGFQVLHSTDSGFKLLDRILVRAWIAAGAGESIELHRGPFFFYFYINGMLMMCRPCGEDGGSLYTVPPLLQPDYECQFTSGEYKAQYVLDMVRHKDTEGTVYMANVCESEEASTVLVAARGSYVPVNENKLKAITEKAQRYFGSTCF